jgi:hypothetical protein
VNITGWKIATSSDSPYAQTGKPGNDFCGTLLCGCGELRL